jgi:ParB family chromosome partitioning protein
MGHARALINVDTVDKQLYIFNEIKNKALSVRQTEELVRKLYKQGGGVKKSAKSAMPPGFQKIEDKLASHFSTRVKLRHGRNGSGQINIEYYSIDELNNILRHMDISMD